MYEINPSDREAIYANNKELIAKFGVIFFDVVMANKSYGELSALFPNTQRGACPEIVNEAVIKSPSYYGYVKVTDTNWGAHGYKRDFCISILSPSPQNNGKYYLGTSELVFGETSKVITQRYKILDKDDGLLRKEFIIDTPKKINDVFEPFFERDENGQSIPNFTIVDTEEAQGALLDHQIYAKRIFGDDFTYSARQARPNIIQRTAYKVKKIGSKVISFLDSLIDETPLKKPED